MLIVTQVFFLLELIQVVHTVLLWDVTGFTSGRAFSGRFPVLFTLSVRAEEGFRIAVLESLTRCSKKDQDDRGPWMLAMVSSPGPLTAWQLVGILQLIWWNVSSGKSVLLFQDLHPPFVSRGERGQSVRRGCALQELWEVPGAWWADCFPVPRMQPLSDLEFSVWFLS